MRKTTAVFCFLLLSTNVFSHNQCCIDEYRKWQRLTKEAADVAKRIGETGVVGSVVGSLLGPLGGLLGLATGGIASAAANLKTKKAKKSA